MGQETTKLNPKKKAWIEIGSISLCSSPTAYSPCLLKTLKPPKEGFQAIRQGRSLERLYTLYGSIEMASPLRQEFKMKPNPIIC